MTQPVFDIETARRVTESTRVLGVPLVLGIMPLVSERNAEFLHHEVPGIDVPEAVRKRMAGKRGTAGRAEGVAISKELMAEIAPHVQGYYLITPMNLARTCRALGVRTVAVYSEADALALHVRVCDEAQPIGGAEASRSYLDVSAIVEAARRSGADALHPGYGFLSESPALADAVSEADLVFVGPPAAVHERMGDKKRARRMMAAAGVPVLPGYDGDDQGDARLAAEAGRIGWPVMLKPARGGGGKGMRVVRRKQDFAAALEACRSEAVQDPVAVGHRHVHQAHRLGVRGAAWAGDAGDRDRQVDFGALTRTGRHGAGHLLADRADPLEQKRGDPQHLLLGAVVVGHVAPIDHRGRARDLGQAADDQAAGAGFGGRQAQPAPLAGGEQAPGQVEARCGKGQSHSRRSRASAPA
jgi:hypothetical protein